MTASELSLKQVREKAQTKVFRASDFLSEKQVEEVKKSNYRGKKKAYNAIDAYVAEIIARFGYDTYVAWKDGSISEDSMLKYILAERAREAQNTLALESIIIASVAGANRPGKHGATPKSLKMAIDILKKEQNKAKGEF